MPNVGPWELIILLVIVLLVFGAKRLPEIGRSMGKGMREFKDSVSGKDAPAEIDPATPEVTAAAVEEEEPVSVGDRNSST